MDLEQTVDAIAPHIREAAKDLPLSESATKYRGMCFPVGELAQKTGTSPRMLGKIRKRFKTALARAITPGREPEFEVLEHSYFGKSAISVRRIRAAT